VDKSLEAPALLYGINAPKSQPDMIV